MGKQSGFQDSLFFRVVSGRPDLGLCLRLSESEVLGLTLLFLILTPEPAIHKLTTLDPVLSTRNIRPYTLTRNPKCGTKCQKP